jgi:hypothetical protein
MVEWHSQGIFKVLIEKSVELPLSPPHITRPTIISGLRCKMPENSATDMAASLIFKVLNKGILNTL